MKLKISPNKNLKGTFKTEPSKSHSFRALILAAVADGTSTIIGPKESSDWINAIKALKMMGIDISQKGDTYTIKGVSRKVKTPNDIIDVGNSGICFRYIPAIATTNADGYSIFTGDYSIRNIRRVDTMLDGLRQLGVFAKSSKGDGHAPIIIKGPINGGEATIDDIDPMPVIGLLTAAAMSKEKVIINWTKPNSTGWVDYMLYWFDKVGIKYTHKAHKQFIFEGTQSIVPFNHQVELDWSAAMYPIMAGVLTSGSEVFIKGLTIDDVQPDMGALVAMKQFGADITENDGIIMAKYTPHLKATNINCSQFHDQFVTLAVMAAFAEGTSRIDGAQVVRNHECDRIDATYKELTKLGIKVEELDDGLIIHGDRTGMIGADLKGYMDHRIVMAFSVAAMNAKGESTITDAESIEKTYTEFVTHMNNAGASFDLI